MNNPCETCPEGVWLAEILERKRQVQQTKQINQTELGRCGLRDYFSGYRDNVRVALRSCEDIEKHYERKLPNEVEEAMGTCTGPYERFFADEQSGKVYGVREQICGARVLDHVLGQRVEIAEED